MEEETQNIDLETVNSRVWETYSKADAFLREAGMNPVLYGSAAVSAYVGDYKPLGDVDILVEDEFIDGQWDRLVEIMSAQGYTLVDLHEREFADEKGLRIALSRHGILERDKIGKVEEDMRVVERGEMTVTTLSPEALIRAYEFSAKDGYRKDVRGKKDWETIKLLEDYIARR